MFRSFSVESEMNGTVKASPNWRSGGDFWSWKPFRGDLTWGFGMSNSWMCSWWIIGMDGDDDGSRVEGRDTWGSVVLSL